MHNTLIENLVKLFEINSGWPEQRKLREALTALDLTVYERKDGSKVLVATKAVNEHLKNINR